MLIFDLFRDRFWKSFCDVFGSTVGGFGGQKVASMSYKIDVEIGIENSSSQKVSPAGARRIGRKEGKKKRRTEEGTEEGRED